MQDNRRHKRFTLNVTEVNTRMVLVAEVKVIDISVGGILLKTSRRLNIGSEYALKLGAKNRVISLRGGVIWSSLSESRAGVNGVVTPIYRAGLKFKNMSTESITELLNFIELHKKEEVDGTSGDRLNIRFHIDSRRPVIDENENKQKDANRASDESLPFISRELIDKLEYLYKWHKTMGYYKLLCIKEWATDEQIKRAFHTMARELHPDKHPGISQDLKQKMNVIFAYINEAYSTLMNPLKRKEYDRIPVSRIRR